MSKNFTIRLLVLLIVVSVLFGSGFLWWRDATSSIDPQNDTQEQFVVQSGESVRSIAGRLKSAGLIKDQIGFFLLTKLLKLDEKLQAGEFQLSRSMDAYTIAQELTHGSIDVRVTIVEGLRNEEIALKLAQMLSIPEQEFLKVARSGYMFPDTYFFPKDASASSVAAILNSNFENKVTIDLRNAIEQQGLTLDQGVVLASIVEREGRTDSDRPVIAAILLSRFRQNYPLQADATLQFSLGYQANEKTWWKKTLFDEDKLVDSPYNTYKNTGLPPAPITNPGLASIKAVAYAQPTDYFYYLHDPSGAVHYAKTLDEHNTNVQMYLK